MATVALTKDTFTDTVTRDGIVLVDWWAGWCGPCRMFAPVFERASDNHTDITFGKVDTEAEQEIAMAAKIRGRTGRAGRRPATSSALRAGLGLPVD